MHRVLILGAGKIGALISGLLADSGAYRVQLADVDGAAAEAVVRAHGSAHLTPVTLDASNAAVLAHHLAAQPVDRIAVDAPVGGRQRGRPDLRHHGAGRVGALRRPVGGDRHCQPSERRRRDGRTVADFWSTSMALSSGR